MVDADKLSRLLNIKKGDVYNKSYLDKRLNSDEDAVANYFYLNNGYLFFRAMPVETVVGNDSINVEIRMVEGPQATIDRVIIKGNDRTHEHVIRRELYTIHAGLHIRENCSAGKMLSGVYGNWLIWDISIPKKSIRLHYRTRKPER